MGSDVAIGARDVHQKCIGEQRVCVPPRGCGLRHRALGQGRSLRIDLRVTTQRARGGGSGGGAEVGAVAVCLKTGITVTVL